jgi:PAS domain S-box-containing protein
LESAAANKKYTVEVQRVRKNGQEFWADVFIDALRDADGTLIGFVEMMQDATGRREIKKRDDMFRLIVDGVADYAIYMLDTKGYVQSWNTGAERIKKYKEDEIIGQHFSIFYTEDECVAGKPLDVLAKATANGKHTSESWLVRKDGERFRANIVIDALSDPQGNLIGFSSVIRDVTERRKMEAALRYSEKRNELALRGLSVGLWDWNVVKDELYWSPRFKTILGINGQGLTFRLADFSDRLHPDDKGAVLFKLEKHLHRDGPYDVEYRLRRADGTYVWIRARGQCEWDENEQPLRMVGSVEDISERKAVDRMKDEFVAMVSHELRTPLTSIHGALGLICGGMTGELSTKTVGLTQIAYKNSERLSHIINDILDVGKIESGAMQMDLRPIEVAPFLRQVLECNRPYGDKYQVTFVLQGEPAAARVLADPDRLTQVFTNLLSNAAKFSPQGAVVHVSTERRDNYIRFSVRDYGEGIPYEFRSRIFEKFSQADSPDTRRCDGTGLGLNIAKKIIGFMNGKLDFDSKIGEGTTFYFDLPDADRSEQALQPPARGVA